MIPKNNVNLPYTDINAKINKILTKIETIMETEYPQLYKISTTLQNIHNSTKYPQLY